jgi:hypothetical protein
MQAFRPKHEPPRESTVFLDIKLPIKSNRRSQTHQRLLPYENSMTQWLKVILYLRPQLKKPVNTVV